MLEHMNTEKDSVGRVLRLLEVPSLVAVPVALVACAVAHVEAAAGLTMLVCVVCLGLFACGYERSRPGLRQVMPTVVLGAVAAAGRVLFCPIPDVKPVSAIAILAGARLGRRNGFMVGAIAALASNMFFGQGPWTPWQMYAWGMVGYWGGVLGERGLLDSVGVRMAYGFGSAMLYGLMLNSWYVVGYVNPITWANVVAAFVAGFPLDAVHGISTCVFLQLIWVPWGARVERAVRAYGLR